MTKIGAGHFVDSEVAQVPKTGLKYPRSLEEDSGFFGKLFLTFLNPIFRAGSRKQLSMDDFPPMIANLLAGPVSENFNRLWKEEKKKPAEEISLFRVYFNSVKWTFFVLIPVLVIAAGLPLVSPYLLAWGLSAFADLTKSWEAFGYLSGVAVVNMLFMFLMAWVTRVMWHLGVRINGINMGAMFKKMTKLSNASRQQKSQGVIMNLLSSDVQTIFNFWHVLMYMVLAPIQLIGALILLYERIGWSIFVGMATMVVLSPINAVIGARFESIAKQKQEASDSRLKIVQDILNGIRCVKSYGWEAALKERVEEARAIETSVLLRYLLNYASFIASMGFIPVASMLAIFAAYALSGGPMTAPIVFSALNLLDLLRLPLGYIPMMISMVMTAKVSTKRIEKFLLMEEQGDMKEGEEKEGDDSDGKALAVSRNDDTAISKLVAELDGDGAPADPSEEVFVVVSNGEFTWPPVETDEEKKEKEKGKGKEELEMKDLGAGDGEGDGGAEGEDTKPDGPTISGISFKLCRGDLLMVVSPVGAGSSSLLSAILGEIDMTGGGAAVKGRIALVEQKPWLGTASVRDNITLGQDEAEVDEALLNKVIDACALHDDIKLLAGGLDAEIGERGINLSGGQAARVALARAIYNESDVYLLDDILSAVDAHVGKHIFDKVLHPKTGMLRNKAVILTTNQLQFLGFSSSIVVMDTEGKMKERGSFDYLMNQGLNFAELIHTHAHGHGSKRLDRTLSSGSAGIGPQNSPQSPTLSLQKSEVLEGELEGRKGQVAEADKQIDTNTESAGKLINEEERSAGSVPLSVYLQFMKHGGGAKFMIPFISLNALSVLMQYGTYIWISIWTDGTFFPGWIIEYYLLGYTAVGVLALIVQLIVGMYFAYGFQRAVANSHLALFERIVRAPMRFFDTTPTGRILNRFSKDVFQMDMEAPAYLQYTVAIGFQLLASLGIVIVMSPPMAVVCVLILVVFWKLQNYYRKSTRETQRLDAVSKSYVVSTFSESISGLSTLRSFGMLEARTKHLHERVDSNHKVYYAVKVMEQWLSVRSGVITGAFSLVTGACLVFLRAWLPISASFVGLAMTNASLLAQLMGTFVQVVTEMETKMTSVERIQEYSNVEIEAPAEIDREACGLPKGDWPSVGQISFDGVQMRYREELPLVLKDVSFDLKGGEKLGIVGRTGSGKSSLAIALLRIVELAKGSIHIDGVDVSKIGLNDLRHNVVHIPQQPVMFEGSVRFNLDPLGLVSDADLWSALEIVQLKYHISGLERKLESPVREGGSNFSVGQRQLVNFARALLRKPRVLILDEATASVDVETDAIVQRLIREQFASATVITIAHRLNTIMDSHRILVMHEGSVSSIDTPLAMLDDYDSLFSSLVRETGRQNASHLRSLAEKAAKGKVSEYVHDIIEEIEEEDEKEKEQ